LGSKSQVTLYKGHLGIGVAEPSGQLELAGDERIQEYPPRAMTGYETLVEGHGVFCASTSSGWTTASGYAAYNAFDNDSTTFWVSQGNGSDLSYDTNGIATSDDRFNPGGGVSPVNGSWIKLKLPYGIKLGHCELTPRPSGQTAPPPRQPKSGIIWGSNDDVNWEQVSTFLFSTIADLYTFTINSSKSYKYITLQVTATQTITVTENADYDSVAIVGLKFFGTPGPTTLDKGSLSLTRSLDVPRISRYDVDTETPRPEKLLVDFDTTVNSSPTDISGQGNHGTFYNGASYSAADKAFDFDGTNDSIRGVINNPAGDWVHSISFWFKLDIDQSTLSGRIDPFTIGRQGTGGVGRTTDLASDDLVGHYSSCDISATAIAWYFFGNDTSFPISGIKAGEWHHLTFAYEGGGAAANRHCFFDGVEYLNTSTNSANLDMFANSILALGVDFGRVSSSPSYFTGQLSNFKIYNAYLEPSEIKKLYRLGRTGRSMVISDTAVGIGKVPEAQLDVRGVASFERVGIGTTNPGKTLDVNGRLRSRYSSGYKSGTFDTSVINIGPLNELTTDMPQIGWEIHLVFSCANSNSTIKIYGGYRSSGGVDSLDSGTLYALLEASTWRWSVGNAHEYLSGTRCSLVQESGTGMGSYYAVIRVVNSHYTNADEGNGRVHVSSECVGTRTAVGATLFKGIGYLPFAAGDNGRIKYLRVNSSSGNFKGQWTAFPITT